MHALMRLLPALALDGKLLPPLSHPLPACAEDFIYVNLHWFAVSITLILLWGFWR